MEKNVDSPEKKVIAVKLPFDLQERILAFPFLHAISEFFPKSDIHIITPRNNVEILNLLPFKAYYHLFDEHEIKSILDVHPYTANEPIYNVDIFISLTNSFVDGLLGVGFRAKKRVGFADDWKTFVFNQKIKRPIGHHVVEDYMALFELISGQTETSKLKVTSRPLTKILDDDSPYLAINLAPFRTSYIDEEWFELIGHFEKQKIVLFTTDDQVLLKQTVERFISRLPQRNIYSAFYYKDWIELGRMLAFSKGVISYSGPCAAFSSYVGARTLILYENEDPQKTGPFYFLNDVSIMGLNNPNLLNSVNSEKSLKKRATFNMSDVFTQAHHFFRL